MKQPTGLKTLLKCEIYCHIIFIGTAGCVEMRDGKYMNSVKKYKLAVLIFWYFLWHNVPVKSITHDYKIKSGKDIIIYTTTDIHYLSKSLTDNGEAFNRYIYTGDGKQLKYIEEILDAFISTIEATRPDKLPCFTIRGFMAVNV